MKRFTYGWIIGLACMSTFFFSNVSYAQLAKEIDASVDTALELFQSKFFDAKDMLNKAKGVLIFPKVIKRGIGLGAEYGVDIQ